MSYVLDWYADIPPKSGRYLCTVLLATDIRPKTDVVSFSKCRGWGVSEKREVLCWTFLPAPWDLATPLRHNPYQGVTEETEEQEAERKAQEKYQQEMREKAKEIKRRQKENERLHKGEKQGQRTDRDVV